MSIVEMLGFVGMVVVEIEFEFQIEFEIEQGIRVVDAHSIP